MIPLSIEENESYFKQEVCHICKKKLLQILRIALKICL